MRDHPALFHRGAFTDQVLDHLTSALEPGVLVGDGERPEGGGWSGQPGEGTFAAYVVLESGQGAQGGGNPPLGDSDDSWLITYSLRSSGGLRQQADWAADQARAAWMGLPKINYELGTTWRLLRPQVVTLGPMNRNDAVNPPYWTATDTVTAWLARSR